MLQIMEYLLITFLFLLITHGSQANFDCAVQLTVESQSAMYDGSINSIVRCGITHDIPDISIDDISISVSESCGNLDSYIQLANIDYRNRAPTIHSKTLARDVSGRIEQDDDTISYLTVTEHISAKQAQDTRCYMCDVQGLTSQDRTVTASANVVHDISRGMTCPNKDVPSVAGTSPVVDVEDLSRKLANITNCCQEQGSEFHKVVNKLNELDTNFAVETNSLSIKMVEMNAGMASKLDRLSRAVYVNRNNGSLQSDAKEIKVLTEVLSENISNQIYSFQQEIRNELSESLSKCENNTQYINTLSEQISASNVKQEVNKVDEKVVVLDATVQGLDKKVGSLSTTVTGLDNKVGELDTAVKALHTQVQNMNRNMDILQGIHDKLEAISQILWPSNFDNSPFYRPIPSENVFRGKLYLITKEPMKFNINDANKVCQNHGGYLVEFNDDEEFAFVEKMVASQNFVFYTGYTDSTEEGKFVHVESGREIYSDKWDIGQPNGGYFQNCVEMWKTKGGLHDVECGLDNRYICEVPYSF